MAGPAGCPPQHVIRPCPDKLRRSEQHRRVEVALDASLASDAIPPVVEGDAPIQRDDIGPRLSDRLEQVRRIGSEMDARHAAWREGIEDGSRVARDACLVIVSGQRPHP